MRPEVQIVREGLEGVLSPAVATALLFDAIEQWGKGVPADAAQVRDLVEGPLEELLVRYVGAEQAKHVTFSMLEKLSAEDELEVDIDLDLDEEEHEARTREMTRMSAPVSVLIVGSEPAFGDRMLVALGPERVYTHTVGDEPALRHATFSATPVIVLVDGLSPPDITPSAMAAALRQLPDSVQSVLWGAETEWGHEVQLRIERDQTPVMTIEKRHGIEPLLDLVLSRHKRTSTIPPPRL